MTNPETSKSTEPQPSVPHKSFSVVVSGQKTVATIGDETIEFHGGDWRSIAADLMSVAYGRNIPFVSITGSKNITDLMQSHGFGVTEPVNDPAED